MMRMFGIDRPEIVTDSLIPQSAGGEQAANPCNEAALTDTQRQQTPWSEPLSQHCHWSGDGDACFHTAEIAILAGEVLEVGGHRPPVYFSEVGHLIATATGSDHLVWACALPRAAGPDVGGGQEVPPGLGRLGLAGRES